MLVEEASEEAQIARVWGGPRLQPYGNGFLRVDDMTDEQHILIKNEDTKQPRGGSPLGDALQLDQQAVHEYLYAAQDLAEVAAKRCEDTTRMRLGVLPDGRTIFWFACDPNALYQSCSDFYGTDPLDLKFQKQIEDTYYSDTVANCGLLRPGGSKVVAPSSGSHCLWGCVRLDGEVARILTFITREELLEHLRLRHLKWPAPSSVSLMRIPEGEAIRSLNTAIASAACALDTSVVSREFLLSPTSEVTYLDTEGVVGAAQESETSGRRSRVMQLCSLGRSIFELFDANGNARPTSLGSKKGSIAWSEEPPVADSRDEQHEPSDICGTCNTRCEPILFDKSGSCYEGLGCSLASELCFGKLPEENRRLGPLKKLLLSIAQRVPRALYSTAPPEGILSEGMRSVACNHLWSGDCFSDWRSFVILSRTWRSVVQAFAVLVGSIDRTKMPKWWSSDGSGWSQVLAVLALRSSPALMHHLYVFDAAMAEFCSQALSNSSSMLNSDSRELPVELDGLPFDEIVERVLVWAKKCRLQNFKGENLSYCCMCADGGDLLCCELCANVQHQNCVARPLDNTPERFVCHSCLVDVTTLYKNLGVQ